MHFTQSLLATLAILTTASAVVVPETLGDGFFEGARDTATGEMIWTKIEEPAKRDAGPIGGGAARALGSIRRDLGATSASSSSPMEKRDQVGCASGAAVDWNDYWLGHDQINVSFRLLCVDVSCVASRTQTKLMTATDGKLLPI